MRYINTLHDGENLIDFYLCKQKQTFKSKNGKNYLSLTLLDKTGTINGKVWDINKNIQSEILMTTMEEIVPQDSLFRKIDKYIDFTFIYDKVKDLYCENNGRPSIDPVVLFKIVFIQALDGIKSMRQTCKKIKVDAEYRWFLGIPF